MREIKSSQFNKKDYALHDTFDGIKYYIPDDESEYIVCVDEERGRFISTGFYEMDDFGYGSEYNLVYDKMDNVYKCMFELS